MPVYTVVISTSEDLTPNQIRVGLAELDIDVLELSAWKKGDSN